MEYLYYESQQVNALQGNNISMNCKDAYMQWGT